MRMPEGFAEFIGRYFEGKIQKISVNAAFPCPNRDGSKGVGGCIYCNNAAFSPGYTLKHPSVREQIEQGRRFFSRKYPTMRYLAYFQSYTSTNGDVDRLMAMYEEALAQPGVVGLVIGTRPDCMPQRLLDNLAQLRSQGTFVMIEYGAETSHDKTLDRINRCHHWEETEDAVRRTHEAGIPVGLHLIMGLPGETREEMLQTIDAVNGLPVDMVKIHQMQVIRGTRLAAQYEAGEAEITTWKLEDYLEFCCRIIKRLRPGIAVERFVSSSPADMLVAPRWGVKNYEFAERLRRKLGD